MFKYKKEGYFLKIGDRIAVSLGRNSKPFRIETVVKITKTLAICDNKSRYQKYTGYGFYAKPYQRSNICYEVIDDD